MKNNKSKPVRLYKQWIILFFILLFLWFIIIYLIIIKNENKKRRYLDYEFKSFHFRITSILGNYENLSNYIFYENKHKTTVQNIFKEAYYGNNDEKKELATELEQLLQEEFERLENYGFSQFNFLFPNGESFVKFQSKNDKNKFKSYENAKIANIEKTNLKNFEEGAFYNGYRYVYIIPYKNKYIGVMEISISLTNLIKNFSNSYPDVNINYMINKTVLSPISHAEPHIKSVEKSYFFDDYVNYFSVKNNEDLKNEKEAFYFEKNKKEIQKHIKSNKSFGVVSDFEDKKYISLFIPVKGKKSETIGYLISTYENSQYDKLYDNLYTEIIFVNLIIIVSLMSAFIFIKDRNKFRDLAGNDYLTGLCNRARFMEFSNYELEKHARYNSSFCILLMDIDYFKKINDNYGHNIGDEVLKAVSALLKNNVRKTDIIARWGGEEFICLLPDTEIDIALFVGEKIREIIEKNNFTTVGKLTLSIGIHKKTHAEFSIEEIIEKADIALYDAKKNGRNRVIKYEK